MIYSMIILQLTVACRNDIIHDIPSPNNGKETELTLTLNIPGMQVPRSRSGLEDYTDPPISLLGFRVEGGTEKVVFIKKYDGTVWNPHSDTGISEGKLQVKLRGVATGGYNRFAVLVNTDATTMLTENVSTYEDVKNLEVGHTYNHTFQTVSSGGSPTHCMKMYGELKADTENGFALEGGVSKTIPQEIPLLRMFAGILIKNEAISDFRLSAVYACRTAKKGRLYGDVATYTSRLHLPTSDECLTPPDYGHYVNRSYDPHNPYPGRPQFDVMVFHLAEQPNPPTGSWKAPRLVIKGKYKGTDCFYPIDFTYDGRIAGGAKGAPMPIRRNHKYNFTIKEVKRIGYPTIKKALESPESFTNSDIAVSVQVIDEAFVDVIFDDANYLAVTRTQMQLPLRQTVSSTGNKFELQTNYSRGWKISCVGADGTTPIPSTGWMRVSTPSNPAGGKSTVSVLTEGVGDKEGFLVIQAGRLVTRIRVNQKDFCGWGGTAKFLAIGSSRAYLTHRYGTKCWMVQNSKEGNYSTQFGRTSVGGYYPYVYRSLELESERRYSCPPGWHIPTNEEAEEMVSLAKSDPNGIGKFWWGPLGAVNHAFEGALRAYGGWGTNGYWVINPAGIPGNNEGAAIASSANYLRTPIEQGNMDTSTLMSVRCVRDRDY